MGADTKALSGEYGDALILGLSETVPVKERPVTLTNIHLGVGLWETEAME